MTSVGFKLAALLLCLAPGAAAFSMPALAQPAQAAPAAVRPAPPAALAARIRELGAGFNGRVGIAVQAVDEAQDRRGLGAEHLARKVEQRRGRLCQVRLALPSCARGRESAGAWDSGVPATAAASGSSCAMA